MTVDPSSPYTGELPTVADPANSGFYELDFNGMRREYFLRPFKEYPLPAPALQTQIHKTTAGFEVKITAGNYAFFVFAEEQNALCRWSDNAVTLYPGETIILAAYPEREMSLADFKQGFHLYQIQNGNNILCQQ